jgi:hypothetical protein
MNKHIFLFAFIFSISCFAHADVYVPDMNWTGRGYASAEVGDGRASNGGDMERKTFEVRFGTVLPSGGLGDEGEARIDIVHYNEGHPENNHRDGFAVQIVVRAKIFNRLSGEVGVGPYLSFNTTTVDGKELNDKNVGALTTAALLYYLNNSGLHLRGQLNYVVMPGGANSVAGLIGLGQDFGATTTNPDLPSGYEDGFAVSVMVGMSKTNHGDAPGAHSAEVEISKQYTPHLKLSLAMINEGDDGVRVDRSGVAAQAWYVQPLTDKWVLSAGAGPYIANNSRDNNGNSQIDGVFSIRAERNMGGGYTMFVDFTRVASRDNNDRDLGRIGLQKKFR